MVKNLKMLKNLGMDGLLKSKEVKVSCPSCADVVCVHNGKCRSCGYMWEKT